MESSNTNSHSCTESVDLSECLPNAEALACLDFESAKRLNVLPIAVIIERAASTLLIACADVSDIPQKERIVRHVSPEYQLRFVECVIGQLPTAILQHYRARPSLDELLTLARDAQLSNNVNASSLEIPVELVNALLVQAASMQASDIHLSPESDRIQIRLRVDGFLLNFSSISKSLLASLLVRIKIMASMDIAETRYPQDGQCRRVVNGRSVDFRVSTFPTVNGENTVLRLIDAQLQLHRVSNMNLPTHLESKLTAIMKQPEGLIVVCGPTGSGKSTTLFALLEKIDHESRSVMTLEDPVEHRVRGIRQTTIDASRHWGYSEGLRALLRQDPDVLLVGEIRDSESCSMVLRAVSTGHKVLTTVHASDAHAALHRLRELSSAGGALAIGLAAVIAQRLIRQVCKSCGGTPTPCSVCHGTGYSGRRVIMELLEITDDVKTLLARGADIDAIRLASDAAGFTDLHEQAQLHEQAGDTTSEEIQRVLGDSVRSITACGQ